MSATYCSTCTCSTKPHMTQLNMCTRAALLAGITHLLSFNHSSLLMRAGCHVHVRTCRPLVLRQQPPWVLQQAWASSAAAEVHQQHSAACACCLLHCRGSWQQRSWEWGSWQPWHQLSRGLLRPRPVTAVAIDKNRDLVDSTMQLSYPYGQYCYIRTVSTTKCWCPRHLTAPAADCWVQLCMHRYPTY
jgi:hypothetical protein